MAQLPDSRIPDIGPSGGGSAFDPTDVGGASWQFDPVRQTWVWGWSAPGGGVTPAAPQGGGNANADGTSAYGPYASGYKFPDQVMPTPPTSLDPNAAGPSGGGGGGGLSAIGAALKKLGIPLGVAAAGRAMSAQGGGALGAGGLPPEMQELLRLSMDRMRSQQPLFEAVTTQALAGLPTYAKQGNQ